MIADKSDRDKNSYRQWRAMLAISRASLKSMMRSPSAIIFGMLFPLVFIVAFGFIQTNTIKLDVAIDTQSDTTGVFYKSITSIPSVRLKKGMDSTMLADQLQKGRIDAILHIDTPGTSKERITVTTSKAARERARFVIATVDNIVHEQNLYRLEARADAEGRPPIPCDRMIGLRRLGVRGPRLRRRTDRRRPGVGPPGGLVRLVRA